jgi:hypothetical protein
MRFDSTGLCAHHADPGTREVGIGRKTMCPLRRQHLRRLCAMLYMVEMDFRNPAREADWHIWYLQHIANLIRTVPGFRASQRFRAITPTSSPWLAMHDVVSAAVFQTAEYRASGGPAATGEWQAEHTNWYRNLFAGIDSTPDVASDAHLLVSEGDAQVPEPVAGPCWREL